MIELTSEINSLLDGMEAGERQRLLKAAWELCCDGEILRRLKITEDLWDGKHEEERLKLEVQAVSLIYWTWGYR